MPPQLKPEEATQLLVMGRLASAGGFLSFDRVQRFVGLKLPSLGSRARHAVDH